ncbi:helix-turn-helix domain-containing protein [Mycetocola reblochoni]|nr:helix-turn-helix domain-containing protein [Mycetocola reblochoni]
MRAEARRLHAEGLGCNAIAKRIGISPAAVSRWAKREGLVFDRSRTKRAVEAHTVDLAAARLRLVGKMATAAEGMLDSIGSPYLVYNFGGKDNTYEEHTLASPPVEVKRSIIVTAGIAFDKASRIVERDPDVSGPVSTLQKLETAFESILRTTDTPDGA